MAHNKLYMSGLRQTYSYLVVALLSCFAIYVAHCGCKSMERKGNNIFVINYKSGCTLALSM